MIEILFASSMTVIGIVNGVRCEFSQVITRSSYTAAGAQCAEAWRAYLDRKAGLCSNGACLALYIIPPTCETETVPGWKRQVGFCDDGVVRWREVAQ